MYPARLFRYETHRKKLPINGLFDGFHNLSTRPKKRTWSEKFIKIAGINKQIFPGRLPSESSGTPALGPSLFSMMLFNHK